MSDYIKREDAIFVALQQPLYSVVSQIKQLEGIDIVRCKECVHYISCPTMSHDHCNHILNPHSTNADDFCSYGERSSE